jgi:hypothetical protein
MMKYDLTVKLKDLKGNPIPNEDKEDSTLYDVITLGLLSEADGEGQPVRGGAKVKRYKLFTKILGQTEVELTAEEVTLINEALLVFPTLVCGQAQGILNQGA